MPKNAPVIHKRRNPYTTKKRNLNEIVSISSSKKNSFPGLTLTSLESGVNKKKLLIGNHNNIQTDMTDKNLLKPTVTTQTQTQTKQQQQQSLIENAGKQWFNMQPSSQSESLKSDMKVIQMRNYLDPKKFYKSSDKFSKFAQVGTVIEGNAEFFSSRLTNKERRGTLLEEVMSERKTRAFTKKTFNNIQKVKSSHKGKKFVKTQSTIKKNKNR